MTSLTKQSGQFETWIADELREMVRTDPVNRLTELDSSPIFDEPLIGFAAGDDAIFDQLKEVIGEFHLTPSEVLSKAYPDGEAAELGGSQLGVVSFVLPIGAETRRENAKSKDHPSERWAHTRLFGENFNQHLQRRLVDRLRAEGYLAVAPETEADTFQVVQDERVGFASVWSQRHVAFAAGLGTFGLSDGLITRVGLSHRVGSVVVNHPLHSPDDRAEDIHRDCLKYKGLPCMTCQKRCPADAITEDGHDKQLCAQFVFQQIPYIKDQYGIDIYGCGLCQTGVPCEKKVPKSAKGYE